MTILACHKYVYQSERLSLASALLLLALLIKPSFLSSDTAFFSFTATGVYIDQASAGAEDSSDYSPKIPANNVPDLSAGQVLLQAKKPPYLRPLRAFSLRLIRAPPTQIA